MDKLLKRQQVEELCGVSRSYLYQGIAEGSGADHAQIAVEALGEHTGSAGFDAFADLALDGGAAGQRFQAAMVAAAALRPVQFHDEGIERFFAGTFAGSYQEQLLREFDKYLPEKPPWPVEQA